MSSVHGDDTLKAVLCSPSSDPKSPLQTPLMAAAATGVFEVFTTVLNEFDNLYFDGEDAVRCVFV